MGVLKDKFIEQLRLRGYSEKTIKSYTGCVRELAKYYNTPPTELSKEQIKNFFVYLKNTRKLSPASYNHYHASIKYFYSFFNQEYLMRDIPRTKNHKSKPVVLSKEETIKIIETIANIKHRIIDISYNSCRNRNCPKCGFQKKVKWLYLRKKDVLPITYYHVVFTLPQEINHIFLIHCNQKLMYQIFFQAVAKTIELLAKTKKYY